MPPQKRKNYSTNDITQLQFMSGFKHSSEKVLGVSLSEHNHLDAMILNENSNSGLNSKRKASESDFKVKYKTEVCKFWEANGTCRFGPQVKYTCKCCFVSLI